VPGYFHLASTIDASPGAIGIVYTCRGSLSNSPDGYALKVVLCRWKGYGIVVPMFIT
jgi:hypothetical protein